MTIEEKIDEAIELMKNEKACIMKADTCDRNCSKCELVRKTEDLLLAYDMAIKALEQTKWIPCNEKMPEEHKLFGRTISDEVYVTFENPNGERFVKHFSFQNGELSSFDQRQIDAYYEGSVPIAWMPLPKPYNTETEGKNEYIHKTNDTN